MSTPKRPRAQIFRFTPGGVNLTPSPWYQTSMTTLQIYLVSFLFTEMKELREARAKLEMSSHFQIYPLGGKSDPPPPGIKLPQQLY